MSVDFPTDGNPTMTTVASPSFLTENPLPLPAFLTLAAFTLNLAIFAFSNPMWCSVALLYWVLPSSSSMDLMSASIVTGSLQR